MIKALLTVLFFLIGVSTAVGHDAWPTAPAAAGNYQWYPFGGHTLTAPSIGCLHASARSLPVQSCSASSLVSHIVPAPAGSNIKVTDVYCIAQANGTITAGYFFFRPDLKDAGYSDVSPENTTIQVNMTATDDVAGTVISSTGSFTSAVSGAQLLQLYISGYYGTGGIPETICAGRAGW